MNDINSELHVIIIWQNARFMEDKILADVKKSFNIRAKYFIQWSENKSYQNFSRFYAIKSRYAKGKMKHCGSGEFVLLVVEDLNPIYERRETTAGSAQVNINLFDKKVLYRNWTHGGHKIHTTNSIAETNHNLALFFGMSYQEYFDSLDESCHEIKLSRNLVGSDGWQSFSEVFLVLNATIEYIVLRNFEGFFDDLAFDEHLDIDLLVNDYTEAKLVLNSKEIYPYNNRVVNRVLISNELVDFDLRHVGDGYMASQWEKNILKTRFLANNKYFRPSEEIYFFTLLYHALIHKEVIADDYIYRFKELSQKLKIACDCNDRNSLKKLLDDYMRRNDYTFDEPKDMSVGYNVVEFDQVISLKRKAILKYRGFKRFIKNSFLMNVR